MNPVTSTAHQAQAIIRRKIPIIHDSSLLKLVNSETGKLPWKFERVFCSRIFGRDKAKQLCLFIFGGPYALMKIALWLSLAIVFVLFFCLGTFFIVSSNATIAGNVLFTLEMWLFASLVIDTSIAFMILRRWVFWANMALATIGSVSVAFMWGFDARASAIPMYLSGICVLSCFDGAPITIRHYLGIPLALCLIVVLVVGVIMINLSRFPGYDASPIDIGDLGGLALRPILISPSQLASDALLGHLGFVTSAFIYAVKHRKQARMFVVKVHLINEDDPEFDHFQHWYLPCFSPFMASSQNPLVDPAIASSNDEEDDLEETKLDDDQTREIQLV